jgi:GNAT superfamily N-acetyltransferase
MIRNKFNNIHWSGYFPGIIGKITELHAVYYSENWNFDSSFEIQVGSELSEFIKEFRKNRDGLWVTRVDNDFAGCIVIDGRTALSESARLRWFIVDPIYQGQGIGQLMISRALNFCRETGYPKVFLWTFKGLDAARTLYEKMGFTLSEKHTVAQWGQTITEQKFELNLEDL